MSKLPFSWAYYSGLLRDDMGREWGLSVCTFDGNPKRTFTHVGLTEIATGKFRQASFWGRPDRGIQVGDAKVSVTGSWKGPAVQHPHRETEAGPSDHYSIPTAPVTGTIQIGGMYPAKLSGDLWVDVETGTLEFGAPWTWASLRFDSGAREMYYEIGGKAFQWIGTLGKGDPAEEVVPGIAWDADDKGWTYGNLRLVPVAKDHSIRDTEISGFSYIEAFCWIEENGERVGHAFVEVVPPGWGFERRKGEGEMRLEWAHGDKSAEQFLELIQRASQLADDFVDGDTRDPGAMVELCSLLLFGVPGNEFYARNRNVLGPILAVVFTTWECSEKWAADWRKDRRVLGYAWREAMLQVIAAVGLLTGGQKGGRDALLSAVDFYHGPGGVEGYELWEAEQASKAR